MLYQTIKNALSGVVVRSHLARALRSYEDIDRTDLEKLYWNLRDMILVCGEMNIQKLSLGNVELELFTSNSSVIGPGCRNQSLPPHPKWVLLSDWLGDDPTIKALNTNLSVLHTKLEPITKTEDSVDRTSRMRTLTKLHSDLHSYLSYIKEGCLVGGK